MAHWMIAWLRAHAPANDNHYDTLADSDGSDGA